MSNCKPTDEVKSIIKMMAREKVREGHTNAADIVDAIHKDIEPHTALWKNEISDIIAESGHGKPRTKDDLQYTYAKLQKELRAQKDPTEVRSAARIKQIEKQMAEIDQKFKTGNFANEPRQKPVYNEEVQKRQADLERARRTVKRELKRIEYSSRTPLGKAADLALAWRRAAILSGLTTLSKLTAAASLRGVLTPLEEAAISGLRHLPGISKIAEKAPRYGQGFMAGAEGAALKKTFSADTAKTMWEIFRHGDNKYDLLYGKKDELVKLFPMLDMVGQAHGSLKYPAFINEMTRSIEHRSEFEIRNAIKSGMTPEQATAHLTLPSTQAKIMSAAYADGKAAILMNDNKFVNAYKGFLAMVRNTGDAGKGAARVAEYLLPIVKIPTNYFAESTSYNAGLIKAMYVMRNGVEGLTPEQADYIMKNLSKQAVGAAMFATGAYLWQNGKSVGTFYQEGDNKRHDLQHEGDVKIGKVTIPHNLMHTPAAVMLLSGATFMRLYEGEHGKKGSLSNAVLQAEKGPIEDLPFLSTFSNLGRGLKNSDSASVMAGREAGSFVPKLLGDSADLYEWFTGKKKVDRKAKTFTQAIEQKIPVLRDTLPRKQQ